MAKDVSGKSLSSQNSASNSPPSNTDQQKVPPLRIVLNPASNQKSSSAAVPLSCDTSQDIKRDKQDARSDGTSKTGGKVRIKLGTGKQTIKYNTSTNETVHKNSTLESQKLKATGLDKQDSSCKGETGTNYSHLRRITRRSHKTVQPISNEDEESISSMTSTDENQLTTSNNDSDNNGSSQETTTQTSSQAETTSSTSTTAITTSSGAGGTTNNETPRRYKRRKGETSECTLSEIESTFGFQNYKLPNQNSFELFRNIRKQVDKKLKSLNNISARAPHGFRGYMLNRGSYLLYGNKLGNGTNLSVNEDGDLYQPSFIHYKTLRLPKVNYPIPHRSQVPLALPVNSPLYNLFIEQEKERHRMRMQHIKEREKLTLAAEQEIVRVYNQAAMDAAHQDEPFSACTMLKHQEIYNYLDSDGTTIQVNEDNQPDPMKQNGVRTRRRQHEHVSPPPPARKASNSDETAQSSKEKDSSNKEPVNVPEESQNPQDSLKVKQSPQDESPDRDSSSSPANKKIKIQDKDQDESEQSSPVEGKSENHSRSVSKQSDEAGKPEETKTTENKDEALKVDSDKAKDNGSSVAFLKQEAQDSDSNSQTKDREADKSSTDRLETDALENLSGDTQKDIKSKDDPLQGREDDTEKFCCATSDQNESQSSKDQTIENQSCLVNNSETKPIAEQALSDDDKIAQSKRAFLSQLQDIDDKWEKVRLEMLIRHRNEAESLNAVQKLEWEWKAKEVGVCDVRTSLLIDSTFVPRLNISSQDY